LITSLYGDSDNPARLATNIEIQEWVARRHGLVPETGWIEDCKRQHGIFSNGVDQFATCPPERRVAIKQAFEHFQLL
jgi:hypothetical protein